MSLTISPPLVSFLEQVKADTVVDSVGETRDAALNPPYAERLQLLSGIIDANFVDISSGKAGENIISVKGDIKIPISPKDAAALKEMVDHIAKNADSSAFKAVAKEFQHQADVNAAKEQGFEEGFNTGAKLGKFAPVIAQFIKALDGDTVQDTPSTGRTEASHVEVKKSPLTPSTGRTEASYAGVGDGSIEERMFKVLQRMAGAAERLSGAFMGIMESSNEAVEKATNKAEEINSYIAGVEKPTDEVDQPDFISKSQIAAMYEEAGQEVPDWVVDGKKGTKAEYEAVARLYTNDASSEQSNGQLIMNYMNTARNRADEAYRAIDTFENELHDIRKKLVS